MHEGVRLNKNNIWQKDSYENLDNFPLYGFCICIESVFIGLHFNSYHSFWLSNLTLCLYNIDTLNIWMKQFGSEKKFFWQNDSYENFDNFSDISFDRTFRRE